MLKILDKRYGGDGLEESNCLSISAMIALVVLMVVGVMYATYLFIRAMGISDIAGVHISKNLMLSVKSAQGKLYTNKEKDIENWIMYKDENIGLDMKYPNDLLLGETYSKELEFKKEFFNADSKNKSLVYAVVIGKKDIDGKLSDRDLLKEMYPQWEGEAEKGLYGGKEGFKTGVFKSVNGIFNEVVVWKIENKMIYVESRYYQQNHLEYCNIFKKIISEINIT